MFRIPVDQALNLGADREQYEFGYKQRIANAQSVMGTKQTTDISCPAAIPEGTDFTPTQ